MDGRLRYGHDGSRVRSISLKNVSDSLEMKTSASRVVGELYKSKASH